MRVPFVDLEAEHRPIRSELTAALEAALTSNDWILGEALERFEAEFAEYCGVRHAIGTDSGLSALELALKAYGIGDGGEVITAANTFVATVLAIDAAGATPVLVDADPRTRNLDVSLLEDAITPRTRAVIPVDLYGRPAELEEIREVARRHSLLVVEDSCQAHGAQLNGKRAGSFGDAGTFSFYPAKNLGALGDGGMVVTDDDGLAGKLRMMRNYGQRAKYDHEIKGWNRRLDTLQAAFLSVKLKQLDKANETRARRAKDYSEALSDTQVELPPPDDERTRSCWHLYVVRSPVRDRLRSFLDARGIGTGIHYPIPIHRLPPFRSLSGSRGGFPVAEKLSEEVLSLPMYGDLPIEGVRHVADTIREFDAGFVADVDLDGAAGAVRA